MFDINLLLTLLLAQTNKNTGSGTGGTGGSISITYDDTTGELLITSTQADAVNYNPETGELTIGG